MPLWVVSTVKIYSSRSEIVQHDAILRIGNELSDLAIDPDCDREYQNSEIKSVNFHS